MSRKNKLWRPENWRNPHQLNLDEPFFQKELPEVWNIEPGYSAFETGADAMLAEVLVLLKKMGWGRVAVDLGLYMHLFDEEVE